MLLVSVSVLGSDDSAELHFRRASALAEHGQTDEAEHEYLLGLNIAASPEAYNNPGVLYFKKQNLPQAVVAFKQALEQDSDYGRAYRGLGQRLNRIEEAIPLFRRAVNLLPERVQPHHWLGRTVVQVGKTEEGRKELAQVERINAGRRRQASEALSRTLTPLPVDAPAAHSQ